MTAAPRIISTVASQITAPSPNIDADILLKKASSDFDINVSSNTSYIKRQKYTDSDDFLAEQSECSSAFFKPLDDVIEDPGQLELNNPIMF